LNFCAIDLRTITVDPNTELDLMLHHLLTVFRNDNEIDTFEITWKEQIVADAKCCACKVFPVDTFRYNWRILSETRDSGVVLIR